MSMHYDAFQFVLLVISLLAVSYVFHKKTSLVYMVSSIMGKKKSYYNVKWFHSNQNTVKTTIHLEVKVVILRNTLLNKVNP